MATSQMDNGDWADNSPEESRQETAKDILHHPSPPGKRSPQPSALTPSSGKSTITNAGENVGQAEP